MDIAHFLTLQVYSLLSSDDVISLNTTESLLKRCYMSLPGITRQCMSLKCFLLILMCLLLSSKANDVSPGLRHILLQGELLSL